MYAWIKPLIFRIQPETAHELTMKMLQIACRIPGLAWLMKRWFSVHSDRLVTEVAGLKFPNPVGLAAGFDKDARWLDEMATLGFGFVEIGTITPIAQPGNPQPRLFRLPSDRGIINRMGFNNGGMEAAVSRLKRRPKGLIVGGNIGKNKATPNAEATSDYTKCFDALHPHVDYFVVNVSSPNTPGLRELQEKEPLTKLLLALVDQNRSKTEQRPIFLKIAPDLTDAQLDDIIALVVETGIAGVIATNTTIDRGGLKASRDEVRSDGPGGLEWRTFAQSIDGGNPLLAHPIPRSFPDYRGRRHLFRGRCDGKAGRGSILAPGLFRPRLRRTWIGERSESRHFKGGLNRLSHQVLKGRSELTRTDSLLGALQTAACV